MGLKTMQSGKKRRKIGKINGKIRLIGNNIFLVAVVLEIFSKYIYMTLLTQVVVRRLFFGTITIVVVVVVESAAVVVVVVARFLQRQVCDQIVEPFLIIPFFKLNREVEIYKRKNLRKKRRYRPRKEVRLKRKRKKTRSRLRKEERKHDLDQEKKKGNMILTKTKRN